MFIGARGGVLWLATWMAWIATARADVLLVDQGQPQAVIVVADQPSPAAKRAAKLFADTLSQISGGPLPVVAEKSLGPVSVREGTIVAAGREAKGFVLIGESGLLRQLGLSTDGFKPGEVQIATRGNALALFGADQKTPGDPDGSIYATTIFLEQQLGCRWLWPGPEGKVLPKRATVRIGEVQYRYAPRILQRKIRPGGYSDRVQAGLDKLGITKEQYDEAQRKVQTGKAEVGWMDWQCLGGSLELHAGHAFGDYWTRFGKVHPEWFAMQPNGSRDQSLSASRPRLCKTNAELLDQIAKDKIEALNAQRGPVKSVSICPNDGGRTTFCMCPECKKLDPPEGRKLEFLYDDASGGRPERKYFDYVSLTDRMLVFYNAIAERVTKVHPDALLCADAYSKYSAPPLHGKLHPNVVIRFVPSSWTSESKRGESRADWDAWSKAAAKIFYRPNGLLATRRMGVLCLFPHRLAEDLRHLVSTGLVATDFDSCTHSWAADGLNFYVAARLLWNPDLDVDGLIGDYCRTGFGPAAGPVEQYLRRIEALTDEMAQKEWELIEPYTPAVVAELRRLLEEAQRLAGADAEVQARLELLRTGLEFTDVQAQAHALCKADPRPDRAAVVELLERRKRLMQKIVLTRPQAINVAIVAWGEGRPWNDLGWSWERSAKGFSTDKN